LARFRPFRGIRFQDGKVGGLDRVVAPPYDVISPAKRDELYRGSAHNVTRLILNPEGHTEAARQFRAWLSDGTLVRDDAPSFYVYRQDFDCDGAKSRVGVIGAMHLEPFSTGVVRPHERTFAHHKQDRLELTRAVKSNLSAIFGLYSNAEFDPVPQGGWDSRPDVDVVHEEVRNRMWRVSARERVEAIAAAVAERTVFIADGHHRYETALNYYAELHPEHPLQPAGGASDEEDPAAHVMTFLARFEDPGMIILPTHRELVSSGGADHRAFVAALERRFDVERIARTAAGRRRFTETLAASGDTTNVIGVVLRDVGEYLLLRGKRDGAPATSFVAGLDVSVVHASVIDDALARAGGRDPKLEYSHASASVLQRIENGELEGAFLLRPMRAEDMAEACMAGELLPHKSTYFYPKLLTGLVFHSLE
jgi:uncharacterized protein (DUF1015 family)